MDAGDFIDREASLDDEEDELVQEEFDEETGEVKRRQVDDNKPRKKEFEDSSEEEDDDDDEEAERIRQGFIVDDDEDEEDEEQADGTTVKVKKRKKRRRSQREDDEDEGLDEEDLDLMLENTGGETRTTNKSHFKRLKRGREENDRRNRQESRELNEIFSDDEEMDAPGDLDDERFYDSGRRDRGGDGRGVLDEFDDFIEEDEMSDDGQRLGSEDEMRVAGRRRDRRTQGFDMQGMVGLREGAMSDMQDIFGTGAEYEFALVTEADDDAEIQEGTRDLAIHDVFEPSELAEKLLTEEDNKIKWNDVPERFQLARKQFEHLHIGPDELVEEANYITTNMLLKRQIEQEYEEAFAKAVKHVLDFIAVENYEVPFIIQHRKDYLIHAEKIYQPNHGPGEAPYELNTRKMLVQDDLWEIVELDIKFRHILDKRSSLVNLYNKLKDMAGVEDTRIEDGLNSYENVENYTDLHDYMQFRYQSQLRDIAVANSANGVHKRPGGSKSLFEKIRNGRVYNLVRAFGITAEQFATNVAANKKREFAEDPDDAPLTMAADNTDFPDFSTDEEAVRAARIMLAEEIYTDPKMRKALRLKWFTLGVVHVNATEKGVKQIDEHHQYYEFKYLRNMNLYDISERPVTYLKMMKAQDEGLIEIQVELRDQGKLVRDLYEYITSENYSDTADAWNKERREVVDIAMTKFIAMFGKSLKEELKVMCEDKVASEVRRNCLTRLDQTPYKPKALALGEVPRTFTVSNGHGERGRDATVGIFMDHDGNVIDSVKYDDLRDEDARDSLAELLRRRKPDVIGVGGFSVQTNRLMDELRKLVEDKDITVVGEDRDDDKSLIEVVWVQDEVARLYQNSHRAQVDHPDLAPLARYCVALGRYLQSPILEYAALGKDIVSVTFHSAQQLLSEDKLWKSIEAAMVEVVNLVGVDINKACADPYVYNLLQYVSGLGPRKADSMQKSIAARGGRITGRDQLVNTEHGGSPIVFPKIFENCAAFLIIEYESTDPNSDYLDSTRVHPEDYDLGRKMAADALDFDEEDIAAAVEEGGGASAVINLLIHKGDEEKLDDLILEEYAEILERNFNQLKRATLEAVRAELQAPYEELRQRFRKLSEEEVFSMLTGETKESLDERMVVPVKIRRVTDRYISASLDCGIEGNVSIEEMPSDSINFRPSHAYHVGQTIQARIESLSRKTFYAELSLREEKLRQPKRIQLMEVGPDQWDDEREEKDRARLAVKNQEQTRTARVIKHPLFKIFNSRQAEEFLAGQSRGDAVIRPSSMGPDHIAVTWKVADGIYQHVDVLELDKQNEFTVGRTLRVGGKYSYSDLDELIVNHIKSMAKKIDELCANSKFQQGSKESGEKWLEKYCEANPKRSSYCFCLDAKRPGYFNLLYKAGAHAKIGSWHVKVLPGAFELRNTSYPDVMSLCNGFKTMHTHMTQRSGMRGRM